MAEIDSDEVAFMRQKLSQLTEAQASMAKLLEFLQESNEENKKKTSESKSMALALEGDIKGLTSTLSRIDTSHAAVFRTITTIAVLVSVITVGLGALGFKSIEDVGQTVSANFSREISDNNSEAGKLLGQLKTVSAEAQVVQQQGKELKAILEAYRSGGEAADYAYNLTALNSLIGSSEDPRIIKDNEKKKGRSLEVYAVLISTIKHYEADHSRYSPTLLYNASKVAARFSFSELQYRLAEKAFQAEPSASNKALVLRLRADSGDANARDELYQEIRNLGLENPELVLAEAWNLAEHTRDYSTLIAALDARLAKSTGEYIPSYLHAIKAHCLTRRGDPVSLRAAEKEVQRAIALLKEESPEATWYEHTKQELIEVMPYLPKT